MLAYDAASRNFTIEFTKFRKQKLVPRLSLLFDDEDDQQFQERVDRCRKLRETSLAIRRYTQYVDSQPAAMFSPIQQSTLHGVVSKLMRNSDEVICVCVRVCRKH